MLIPVRCFTCGKVIADKWRGYEKRVAKAVEESDGSDAAAAACKASTMDDLGLTRICCRRHMLTTVDMMDVV
jgi:DNA-directed RNA polymerase subunit N (RpoN/RPB10)